MQASIKIAVGLCLLAAVCISKSLDNPTDDLLAERLQIRITLSNVDSITRRLNHIKKDNEEDTIERVTKRIWDEMDNYRDYIQLLRNAMRREVNAAQKKGINAQHCYDTNSRAMDGVRDRAANNSEECKKTAEKNIQKSLVFLDNFKLTGNLLIDELNSLFTTCYDISNIKMKVCIHDKLTRIKNKIRKYNYDINDAEYSALTVSNNIVQQANKCLNDVYVLAHAESEDSMTSHSNCVKKALEEKKQTKRFIRAIYYSLI